MRIDKIRVSGNRTIKLTGSFQPDDLRRILALANSGSLTASTSASAQPPAPVKHHGKGPLDQESTATCGARMWQWIATDWGEVTCPQCLALHQPALF